MSVDAVTPAYEISQEALDLRDMVRQLAQDKIAPRAGDIDRKSEYPWDVRELLASMTSSACPSPPSTAAPGPEPLCCRWRSRRSPRRPRRLR